MPFMNENKTKLKTGKVRFNWTQTLFEPRKSDEEGGAERYGVQILIPKSDTATIAEIKTAWQNAYDYGVKDKWAGKKPECALNLKDGDTHKNSEGDLLKDKYPEVAGNMILNPTTYKAPGVVRKDAETMELVQATAVDFYSGCYGKATVSFAPYTYSKDGKTVLKRGISCYLQNVIKLEEGEPLSNAFSDPNKDFEGE
jgi:hypothetical protein